jgi:small nuclear ribonucleoprotein D3
MSIYYLLQECRKTDPLGKESFIELVYIRGSQIRFIIIPDMLQKAPFFNRIKLWRQFKGNAVFGTNVVGPGVGRGGGGDGQPRSQVRRVEGGGRGGVGGYSQPGGGSSGNYGPGSGSGQTSYYGQR